MMTQLTNHVGYTIGLLCCLGCGPGNADTNATPSSDSTTKEAGDSAPGDTGTLPTASSDDETKGSDTSREHHPNTDPTDDSEDDEGSDTTTPTEIGAATDDTSGINGLPDSASETTAPEANDSDTTDNTDTPSDTGPEGETISTDTGTSSPDRESDTAGEGPIDTDETDTNQNTDASTDWPDDKYISIDAVYEKMLFNDPEMLLINVVDEMFYNLGHIEGSLKITWDTLADRLDEVDSEKHIVIYCRRGVRSESAYTTLIENGCEQVWVMEGGIEAWSAKGYPTVP